MMSDGFLSYSHASFGHFPLQICSSFLILSNSRNLLTNYVREEPAIYCLLLVATNKSDTDKQLPFVV